MNDLLLLFSSALERDAAFPDGLPDRLVIGTTGVGLIDAAAGTARLVAEHQPAAVIFAGTCGAHRESGFEIGDLLLATDVRLGSGDVAQGWMRFPSLLPSTLQCDEGLSKAVAESGAGVTLKRGTLSCTLGVTETNELAETLFGHDRSDAENLEAFSVLRAAGQIPTAILLGVTNIVGAGGGRDWKANYQRMMMIVGTVVAEMQRSYNGVRTTI